MKILLETNSPVCQDIKIKLDEVVLLKGEKGDPGDDGVDGVNGFSPSASVSKNGNDVTISITDKLGTSEVSFKQASDYDDTSIRNELATKTGEKIQHDISINAGTFENSLNSNYPYKKIIPFTGVTPDMIATGSININVVVQSAIYLNTIVDGVEVYTSDDENILFDFIAVRDVIEHV